MTLRPVSAPCLRLCRSRSSPAFHVLPLPPHIGSGGGASATALVVRATQSRFSCETILLPTSHSRYRQTRSWPDKKGAVQNEVGAGREQRLEEPVAQEGQVLRCRVTNVGTLLGARKRRLCKFSLARRYLREREQFSSAQLISRLSSSYVSLPKSHSTLPHYQTLKTHGSLLHHLPTREARSNAVDFDWSTFAASAHGTRARLVDWLVCLWSRWILSLVLVPLHRPWPGAYLHRFESRGKTLARRRESELGV